MRNVRMLNVALGLVAGWAALSAGAAAQAAPFLSVDFQQTGAPTQAGFQAFNLVNGSNPASALHNDYSVSGVGNGTVTVTLLGNTAGGRDRSKPLNSGVFTYSNLVRDLATQFTHGTSAGNPAASIQISGLDANTTYSIQIWALDTSFNNGEVTQWYDATSAVKVPLGGPIVNATNAAPADNDAFSATGLATSNGQGVVILGSTFSTGSGQVNGFTISAVPEPASLGLLGLGGLVLLRRKGR